MIELISNLGWVDMHAQLSLEHAFRIRGVV